MAKAEIMKGGVSGTLIRNVNTESIIENTIVFQFGLFTSWVGKSLKIWQIDMQNISVKDDTVSENIDMCIDE